MNDAQKDAHIARLEDEVGELKIQIKAINSFLLDKDPSSPGEGSRMERVMQVVKLVERSNWAAKSLVYIFLTIGGIASAAAAIRGGFFK